MKKIIIETAIESLLSTLLPIKSILFVQKIPRSIWEDHFLFGYLITVMTKGLELMAKETDEEVTFEDFKYIIQRADPHNATFVIDKFENIDSTSEKDSQEFNRGELIAEKALYLFYGEDNFIFPHIDSHDPVIVEAKRKAPTMGEILRSMSPNNINVKKMDLNQMAAMSINYDYIFGYVKDNISKFEKHENKYQEKVYNDSWTHTKNERSENSNQRNYNSNEKVTLRDIFKSSSKIISKGAKEGIKYAKKGINQALDADLRTVGAKTEKVFESALGETEDFINTTGKSIWSLITSIMKGIFWFIVVASVILIVVAIANAINTFYPFSLF